MSRPATMVAREDALSRALRVVEAARAGTGATVVVEGPAGIGKTTLARTVVDHAGRAGVAVRVAAAHELERELPLVPFVDALGLDPASEDPDRAELGALLRGEPTGDVTQRRWRLATGVAELLEAEAQDGPLLLVVEDAHWLDPDSAVALGRLVAVQQRAPLSLLVTARPEPRPEHVGAVWRRLLDTDATTVVLDALDGEAVERLAAQVLSAAPGASLAAALGRAGGNPLHVTELLEAFRDVGALERTGDTVELLDDGLPPSLRLTIVRRLGVLSDETLDVLRLLAVLGGGARLDHLAAVDGRAVDELASLLEPAYRAHLLAPDDARVRFRHDLIRDALYDDVPAASRAALHAEAATALREAGAAAQQVAVHLSRALEPRGEADVDHRLDVATDALDSAPALAATLATQVLDGAGASPSQRVRARILQVRSALLRGRADEAESLLGELAADDLSTAHRLELWRGLTIARDTRREVDAPPLEEYLRLVHEADVSAEERRRHLAVIATVGAAFDPASSREVAVEALPHVDDVPAETGVLILTAAARSAMFLGDLDAALEHSQRAVELARASERELTWAGLEAVSTFCFLRSIDPAEHAGVVRVATEALSAAESAGLAYALPRLHAELVRVSFFQGQHDQLLTHTDTVTRLATETGFDDMLSVADSMAARVELLRGLDERAEARIARLHETAAGIEAGGVHVERDLDVAETELPFDRARLALIAGDAERAFEIARPAAERVLRMGGSGFVFAVFSLPYAEAAVASGRLDEAAVWADTLAGFADRGSPLDVLAALARVAAEGSADAARAVLPQLDRVAVFPFRFDGYGIVGRVLAGAGDASGAIDAFQRGRTVADAAGASVLVGWYDAQLRELGVRRGAARGGARPDTGWEALTEAEWRVVELVVEGLVYREVGERLFISRRTVETHVANAFRKLGLRSRNELTRAYLEHQATRGPSHDGPAS